MCLGPLGWWGASGQEGGSTCAQHHTGAFLTCGSTGAHALSPPIWLLTRVPAPRGTSGPCGSGQPCVCVYALQAPRDTRWSTGPSYTHRSPLVHAGTPKLCPCNIHKSMCTQMERTDPLPSYPLILRRTHMHTGAHSPRVYRHTATGKQMAHSSLTHPCEHRFTHLGTHTQE